MTVNVRTEGGRFLGPGDINQLPAKTVVVLRGSYDINTDAGHWAPALGVAVLRGLEVRWSDE